MKVAVYNQKAEKVGEVDLADKIFNAKINEHLVAESARIQLSNKRKGLAHTKTRGEVSGGGKKPWKQKGTGRARAGSTRSPIWRHGGVTFGPRSDRNWERKINKKAKLAALYSALTDKVQHGKFIVVDAIALDAPKTKEFATVVKNFTAKVPDFGKKQLFVLPKGEASLQRASRNIASVQTTPAHSLNIVDLLRHDVLFVLRDSIQEINATYLK